MCGIVAAMSQRGLATERRIAALKSLHHRGPDGSGSWTSHDGRWTLGRAWSSCRIDLAWRDRDHWPLRQPATNRLRLRKRMCPVASNGSTTVAIHPIGAGSRDSAMTS